MEHNLDDLIADYLNGTLDLETRRDFEHRLAAEPELAARVELEQGVAAALDAFAPENKLRANLRQISEKYNTPETLEMEVGKVVPGHAWRWWALVALLALGGWAYWNMHAPLPSMPPLESPATTPAEEAKKPDEPEKSAPLKQTQPMAAAFKPIAKLESYIGSQTRSGNLRFRVDEPQSGSTLPTRAGLTTFRLAGKIEGDLPVQATFKALIFSHEQQAFEAMRPLESQVLEFDPNGAFKFQKQWKLSPGLYYLLIEDQQSGEWAFVDKFFVH